MSDASPAVTARTAKIGRPAPIHQGGQPAARIGPGVLTIVMVRPLHGCAVPKQDSSVLAAAWLTAAVYQHAATVAAIGGAWQSTRTAGPVTSPAGTPSESRC